MGEARGDTERALAEAAARDGFRVQLADAFAGLSDPAALRQTACRLLGAFLRVDRALYGRIENDEYVVEQEYRNGVPSSVGRLRAGDFGHELVQLTLEGKRVVCDDVRNDDRIPSQLGEAYDGVQVRSFISVPLIRNEQRIGTFVVSCATPRRWTQPEIELVVETGDRTWYAVERALAELEVQRAAARDGYRIRLADALRSSRDPCAIREVTCRQLTEHLRANRTVFVRVEDGDYIVDCDYCDGLPTNVGRYPIERFGHALREVLFGGHVIFTDDVLSDPRFPPEVRDALVALGVRSFIGAPIIKYGQWIGAIGVHSKTPRRWQQDDVDVTIETTERAWYAVDRAVAENELQRAAARDAYRIKLADALRSASDVPAIRDAATRTFGEFLGANRVMWMFVDEDQLVTEPEYLDGLSSVAGRHPLGVISEHARDVLGAGGALLVDDMTTESWLTDENRARYIAGGVVSLMAIGLVRNGKWVAGFAVNCSSPRVWTEDEQTLLRETAERTWAEIERARAEAALRESEAALREASRRKDEFIAMLSHELRNPLSPLRTATEVLRLAPDKPEILEEMRRIIERQVDHMTHLVDDLLDAARITRGTITLRRGPTSLAQLVDAAVEAHRHSIESARLELTVTLGEDCTLDVDSTRMVQVLSNLLHNAVKFTPGGGRIHVSASVSENALSLTVKDSGEGISADLLPHVFELFRRGEASSERHLGGLGVGLALVRAIVELHGGQVTARSSGRGRGTEIAIRIPSVRMEQHPTPSAPPLDEHCRECTVLVVDDNVDAARSIALLVQTLGGSVEIAPDGSAGLSRARELRPDLVLLDIGMPGIDGYETCRRMRRELGDSIKIVAVTGWGKDEDKQRAMEAGFDEHMTKPADPVRLRELLHQR